MKKLILLLILLPSILFAQYGNTDSWVRFVVQYDFYAPQEANFFMVEDTISGDTVMFHQPTDPYELLDTIIGVNSGDYIVTLNDDYGDGWLSQNPAWFKMINDCQGPIINYDPLTMQFFTLDTLVNIWPCAPPVSGCTNPFALNYDSLASLDDGSCDFIEGCINSNASNYDSTAYQFVTGLITPGGSCNLTQWTQNYVGIDSADYWSNPSLFEVGNKFYVNSEMDLYYIDFVSQVQGNCNFPAVLVYVVVTEAEADGDFNTFTTPVINVAANVGEPWMLDNCHFIYGCTQPNALNYDPTAGVDNGTCINIPGCTDSTSMNYNPAATLDDGNCGTGGPTVCSYGQTLVTLDILVDQYAEETGWEIYTTGGTLIAEQPASTYSNAPMGTVITEYICIDDGASIQFTITDSYGDGLGGAAFGGIDGTYILYTACDTIAQGGGDFGLLETTLGSVAPCTVSSILGCMDPAYVEFNPLANVDDSTCATFNIYGCTDVTAFNYDSLATSQLNTAGCDNILTLTDWANNGWAGSFLVVTQGNNWWGPFTLESNELILDTIINLNTTEKVNTYFYSFNQSTLTSSQCMFEITNPLGNVISAGGTNSFTDPMLSYNQYGHTYKDDAECGDNCIDRIYGCLDSIAINYTPIANTTDNTCYYNPGCMDAAYLQYHTQGFTADYDDGSYCLNYANFGCMDNTAFNYNSLATVNWTNVLDQTDPCIATVLGCTDVTAFNYNSLANTENYTCIPVIYGCMDMTMWNYDVSANTDNNSCIAYIFGCTDSTALNYDALANTDNGTCTPYLYGCTDSLALNYNPLANTDDGSCISELLGCTDSTATNYNNLANTDDGSCIPYIYGCNDPTMFNYDPLANTNDGSCIPFVYGCMDPTMWNYDVIANVDNGSCIAFVYGCTDSTAWNYDPLANTSVGCITFAYGCTDPTQFNYNPLANTDDGSCYPIILGCMDSTAFNYNSLANTNFGCNQVFLGCTDVTAFNYNYLANVDDSSCIPVILGCLDTNSLNFDPLANTNTGCIYPIPGCTDPVMFNYDPLANIDNGSCIPVVLGCIDTNAINYNSLANTNVGCVYPILGCTDPTMFNYNVLANVDDNSCIPVIIGCMDVSQFNFDPTANTPSGNCIPYAFGCMDSTQFNYDPLANTDNGSCIAFIYGCTDATALNYDPLANTNDNSCIAFIYGCTDATMFNYNPLANTDNGSCIPFVYGCTDAAAFNYNPSANTNDNSCCLIAGCTDSTALNYNQFACFDDNSCIVIITGCTDVGAYNYNPAANVTDSTACLYDAGCYGGPGNPYWLNDGCFAWVIDVDDYCCTNDWDASCQSMYDYCQLGWPTSVEDISSMGIMVYPNPTGDIINIDTRLEVEVEIYDLMGKLMTRENSKRINLSDYPNGVYSLILIYNDKRFSTRVVKQ